MRHLYRCVSPVDSRYRRGSSAEKSQVRQFAGEHSGDRVTIPNASSPRRGEAGMLRVSETMGRDNWSKQSTTQSKGRGVERVGQQRIPARSRSHDDHTGGGKRRTGITQTPLYRCVPAKDCDGVAVGRSISTKGSNQRNGENTRERCRITRLPTVAPVGLPLPPREMTVGGITTHRTHR